MRRRLLGPAAEELLASARTDRSACTPGDVDLLPVAVDAAESYQHPMPAAETGLAIRADADEPLIFPISEDAAAVGRARPSAGSAGLAR